MSKQRKGRPAAADAKRAKHAKLSKHNVGARDGHVKNQTTSTSILKRIPILCCLVYLKLSALASVQGIDLQSMLSLQWDAALEQWASKVSPKLASPHLSMAFFMFQDAAFVCALAWSVLIFRLFLLSMGEILSLL